MRQFSRRDFVKRVGLGAAALTVPRFVRGAIAPDRKPNIIFLLMDDMGWMDSTVYGSQYYVTPNMERLAKRGMLFTDAYAANPLCSPTRASIMTGKYPARLGITTPACHLPPIPNQPAYDEKAAPRQQMIFPNSKRLLPLEEYTIAEALKDAGYRTGFIGKWHLGYPEEYWPPAQGFDVNVAGGKYASPPSYFSPYSIVTLPDGPPNEYLTDRLASEAVKFVERNRDKPFFLCYWNYAVHGPWQHKEEITKTFLGKADPRGKQGNPIMASMLKSADEGLGRLLDKLDELNLANNTIVIFFSDNGGVDFPAYKKQTNKPAPRPDSPAGRRIADYERWAGDRVPTNNYPLRAGKATVFEGGTREPCLIVWPGVVKEGSRCSEVVSSVDFYPTLLEMAGARAKQGQILDGESIVPLLKGTGKLKREAIFCHFPHGGTERSPAGTWVRKGDWKLIRVYDHTRFPERFMLYNLKDDIGETANLADKMPDKIKELDALIDKFLKDTGALVPIPNPAHNPYDRPILGWRPLSDSRPSLKDGALVVESAKGRVSIFTDDAPPVTGPLEVRIRMRTATGENGIVYWGTVKDPKFTPERRVDFKTVPDGQWHNYEVPFTSPQMVTKLRLDASAASGRVDVDWIRLCKSDGAVLKEWRFGAPDLTG